MDRPEFIAVDLRENQDFQLPPENEKSLIFHSSRDQSVRMLAGKTQIYKQVAKRAVNLGYKCYVLYGDDASLDLIKETPNHSHMAWLDRPYQANNLVFSMPSYLNGYWYLDQMGVRNKSSIMHNHFDPKQIDQDKAKQFFDEIYAHFVTQNISKWPQEARGVEKLEPHSAVLIMQAEKAFPYEERYVKQSELLDAAIATKGHRTLYIKPHPKAPLAEQAALLEYHKPEAGVVVSVSSIHDLLANADYIITQSSAVALEAQLHKTPAILSGEVDFAHNMLTIRDVADLGEAVDEALRRQNAGAFAYEAFLYWFLKEQLMSINPMKMWKIWQRLGAMGWPLALEVLAEKAELNP